MNRSSPPTTGRCAVCAKVSFTSRQAARRAARRHSTFDVQPYRCPAGNGIHLGHRPSGVARGELTRGEFNRGVRPHRTRPVAEAVRARFDDIFPPAELNAFGPDFARELVALHEVLGDWPTWRQSLLRFASSADHPAQRLLTPSAGHPRYQWREDSTRLLMEELRDFRWIEFTDAPRSLRPGTRAY
ncbi:hypothetical protein [Gordonia humi]|uniref:Uncharacterized protein n=1 Tax=Gordonia humi TaxID=686429 RepID=A0A840F5Q2_9ACTN|nr:hypothetical protein [Gordonia humi]MBB4136839.1 hypothetical protein [Gordonia humi]